MWAVIIIIVIIVLLILFLVGIYNGMVRGRNRVDEAWSGIDVQLKRRHDLIPNLVESVKGYAAHEAGVFEAVTQARAAAMSAQGPAQVAQAEGALSGALGRLFAVAEAYPQLRATENFQQLQAELTNTEDQIAGARRIYNGNVQSYNTSIQTFPGDASSPARSASRSASSSRSTRRPTATCRSSRSAGARPHRRPRLPRRPLPKRRRRLRRRLPRRPERARLRPEARPPRPRARRGAPRARRAAPRVARRATAARSPGCRS